MGIGPTPFAYMTATVVLPDVPEGTGVTLPGFEPFSMHPDANASRITAAHARIPISIDVFISLILLLAAAKKTIQNDYFIYTKKYFLR
jgi:hypothetical protein